jgi:RsiW-degrading membrane proteinase PrsW (M82 family)
MYIYELENWPNFIWNNDVVWTWLSEIKLQQGFLLGKMSGLGFQLQEQAVLQVLTESDLRRHF